LLVVVRLLLIASVAVVAASLALGSPPSHLAGVYLPIFAGLSLALFLVRIKRARLAAWLVCGLVFVAVTIVLLLFGGLLSNNAVAYVIAVMLAGTLLGSRPALVFAILSTLAAGGAAVLELNGHLPQSLSRMTHYNAWIAITVTLVLSALLHQIAMKRLSAAIDASADALSKLRQTTQENETRALYGEALARLASRALPSSDPAAVFEEAAGIALSVLSYDRVLYFELDEAGQVETLLAAGFAVARPVELALPSELRDALRRGPVRLADLPREELSRALGVLGCEDVREGLFIRVREDAESLGILGALARDTREVPLQEQQFLETAASILAGTLARAHANERAVRAQKMEVVGRLASGVAHDFNNLLTAIQAAAFELREGFSERRMAALSPEGQALDDLDSACKRAGLLTGQLLSFSRRKRVVPERIDLNEVAAAAVPMMRRLLGDTITLEAKLSDAPCFILFDRGSLEQVLLNLLVNARDAMPEGGPIELRVEAKECGASGLFIRDHGHGMDDATQRRMFQPFFSTKPDGTGLGLATVLDIVQRHGASIDVESTPGEGTSFAVRFPAAPTAAEREPGSGPTSLPLHRGLSVLLADDHDLVRAATQRMLERLGFKVVAVRNGRDALSVLRAGEPFDVLVADVAMPELDGVGLLEELARRDLSLPTVLVSGQFSGAPHDLDGHPVSHPFVRKPFTAATLAEAIDTSLEQARSRGDRRKPLASAFGTR
jgi:signal transduction histidine kinase